MNIWPWSRIRQLERSNDALNRRLIFWEDILNKQLSTQEHVIGRILLQVNAITPGLGRVIAKLDTQFGRAEIDPARKAESDKLGEEVIKRLEAEAKARAPHNLTQDDFE
jgi:hypothetical protein